MVNWRFVSPRELGPVFLVAVGVALASTLAGAFLDHVHQVSAEDVASAETRAAPLPAGYQTLTVSEWGVQVKVPFATEMPLMSYAHQSGASVGLSSADLEAVGPECKAARNGLGNLLRFPAGKFEDYRKGNVEESYVATIGQWDYAYLRPHNECSYTSEGSAIINREMAVLYEALSSLSAVAK